MQTNGQLFNSMMHAAQNINLSSQVQVAERLEHFSVYSDRLIFLLGPEGSGKSSITELMVQQLPAAVDVVVADCNDANWFSLVLERAGIKSTAGLHSFQFGLGQINPTSDFLLVLDNADKLSLEKVELLANKVAIDSFHCILVCNDDSRNVAWAEDYPDKSILVSVPALTSEECVELLAAKLQVPETQLSTLFPGGELEIKINQTLGNPGKLVALAANTLSGRQSNSNVQRPLKKIILSIAYLLIALFLTLILIYQDDINQALSSDNSNSPSSKDLVVTQSENLIADKSKSDKAKPGNETSEHPAESSSIESDKESTGGSELLIPNPEILERTAKEPINDSLKSETINTDSNVDAPSDSKVKNNIGVVESTKEELTPATPELAQSETGLEESGPATESPVPKTGLDAATNTDKDNAAIDETTLEDKPFGSDGLDKPADEKSETVSKASPFTSEEQYLLSLAPERWVVQLSGFSKLESAAQFMAQHQVAGELHFYRTSRFGGDWFVVVLGPFDNKPQASKVRSNLSAALKKRQPWLKSISTVQEEITSATR